PPVLPTRLKKGGPRAALFFAAASELGRFAMFYGGNAKPQMVPGLTPYGLLNAFSLPNHVEATDPPLFRRAEVGPPVSLATGGGLLGQFSSHPQQQLRKDPTVSIGRGLRLPVRRDDTETAKASNDHAANDTEPSIGDRLLSSFIRAGR